MPRPSNGAIYRRILQQARPYWRHLAGILSLTILGAPLPLLLPIPLKLAVDSAIGSHPLPPPLGGLLPATGNSTTAVLGLAAVLLIATTLLIYLNGLASWLLQTYTGEKLVLDLRTLLFGHLQRLSLTYHDTAGSSESIYRIQYDASCMQWVLISSGMPLVTSVITVCGMVAVTAFIDWRLALVALVVCPALYLITVAVGRRIRERWLDIKELDSAGMAIVHEVLAAVRVVKAFGRERHEQERFLEQSNQRIRRQLDLAAIQGRFDLYIGVTLSAGTALVLYFGVLHVQRGLLTLGDLLIVMAYLAQIYEPLKTASKTITELQSGLASAERAFSLLDHVPEVIERPGARKLSRARGVVEFRGVSFSYDKNRVLHDISFEVPAGGRAGIQGRTGAGKSTLASLLMRFYDPESGAILLDGVDLRDYALADLRNQFSLVLQEPVLFSTSVRENIAYGRPSASAAEIEEAARLAHADEFIRRLPDGYSTQVGERGMKVSGGERQRISLARAFLKDAPILLLDEPTSSIDVKTESVIMDAIERLMEGRTVFMIAHRLGTLEGCDIRLELQRGMMRPLGGKVAGSASGY
jgi:ATP-binding cassette subfamily B protein